MLIQRQVGTTLMSKWLEIHFQSQEGKRGDESQRGKRVTKY